jgi:hypothetical protein
MFILIVKDPERLTAWAGRFGSKPVAGFEACYMSPNLLRPVFARTFRDYLNSMAPVKVKRLTRSIPGVPFVHYRISLLYRREMEGAKLRKTFPRT